MVELAVIAIFTVVFATVYFFIFIHTDINPTKKPIVIYVNLTDKVDETERITREVICKLIEKYENIELYVIFDKNSNEAKIIFEKIISGKCKYTLIEI